jgi:hypothetical protein
MKQMVARFPAPLIATVSRAGNVKVYLTRDKLIGKVAENAARAEKSRKHEAATTDKKRRQAQPHSRGAFLDAGWTG